MQHKRGKTAKSVPVSLLKTINQNVAGIDCGSAEHYVAVPPDRDPTAVRSFKTFTHDLYRLAEWLSSCGITSVAMESTGVYWIPIYQILEARGFEVVLVNARHVKNVPGRKSDVSDCEWLSSGNCTAWGFFVEVFARWQPSRRSVATFVTERLSCKALQLISSVCRRLSSK